jgi:hypothetical protein
MLRSTKNDVAGGMAGAMQHLEGVAGNHDVVAFHQPAVRLEGAGIHDAIALARLRQALEQETVPDIGAPDRHRLTGAGAQLIAQPRGAAGVIDMAMGQQDVVDLDVESVDDLQQPIDVAAGIDDHAMLGEFAPDDGAVLPEGRDLLDSELQVIQRFILTAFDRSLPNRHRP